MQNFLDWFNTGPSHDPVPESCVRPFLVRYHSTRLTMAPRTHRACQRRHGSGSRRQHLAALFTAFLHRYPGAQASITNPDICTKGTLDITPGYSGSWPSWDSAIEGSHTRLSNHSSITARYWEAGGKAPRSTSGSVWCSIACLEHFRGSSLTLSTQACEIFTGYACWRHSHLVERKHPGAKCGGRADYHSLPLRRCHSTLSSLQYKVVPVYSPHGLSSPFGRLAGTV